MRQAIETYLREERGIDPDAMETEMIELHLDGDDARALVRFSSGDASDGLEMEYRLHRSGAGWSVVGSGTNTHGQPGSNALPEGHPVIPEDPPDTGPPPGA